jgi:YegS/Rv2252/BmrU family lipid kinase
MEHVVVEGGVVIFNPTAGRGTAEKAVAEAKERLGPAFDFRPTQRPGHAIEMAREAARTHQVVVAMGGDGTAGDVARGLYGTDASLGILPLGTGNDLARNLGLKLELHEACATILGGVVRRIDVGLINGTPFINNCGTGFDAAVMRTMNSSIRFSKGQPAFVLAVLKTTPGFKPFSLTLEADDEAPVTHRAMLVSILNGAQYGGGMKAAPTAEMDDGMMDVMIVKAMAKPKLLLGLFPKVIQGQHVGHPAVEMLRVRKLKMTTLPPQPLNIDGDVKGLTPAEITVNSRAIKVLVR